MLFCLLLLKCFHSIGFLNRVNFDVSFVLKSAMTLSPGTIVLLFTCTYWVVASWILRHCERQHPIDFTDGNFLNALWFVAVTFLCIGYGDIAPRTLCGRSIAAMSGIMVRFDLFSIAQKSAQGLYISSLLVAIIARKLEMTRDEKKVHTFAMDRELAKKVSIFPKAWKRMS